MKKLLLSIALMVSATMSWALEVECTPGNLANLIYDTSITSLTITGQMDARDFKFITDSLDALTVVDLSGVTIVAYSNHTKPLFNNEVDHPANCIPAMAFFGKRITDITLPEGIKGIGMGAFAGCNQLSSFTFPESLDSIASFAFSATKLNSIHLPSNVRVLGEGVFSNNTNLSTARINPASPMEIPKSAFEGCTKINNIFLGPNVTSIGDRAFKGTERIYQFVFTDGNNITHIGKEAFLGSKINNFDFQQASTLTSVDDWAFAQTKQVSAVMPNATSRVGKGAFYYAEELTSFIPNHNCDTIADMAFAGTAITNDITNGTQVRYIGHHALYNTPITELTLPATLDYIGTQAMAGMIELQQLTSNAVEVPELGESVWLGIKQATIPLTVPEESYDAYCGADQWCHFLISWDENFVYGDVNQDGFVTAADVTAIYDILLGNSTMYTETADVTQDGFITAADITAIYNILLGTSKAPSRLKPVSLSTDIMSADAFVIETGKTHDMSIDLSSSTPFSAIQLDLNMPQGLSIDHVATTSRTRGMTMGYNEIEPGKWRILIHNANAMNGNEGTILNVTVKAGDSFGGNDFINIDNIIAVEPSEQSHFIADLLVEVGNTTGVKDINIDQDANGPVNVYNMNGQLLRKDVERSQATQGLPAGIYIVGNKKVIVK
jgi:hypothetical protein